MGTFTAGQVVIVHFPFSDLTASKLRPAVVLAEAGRGDGKAISLDAPDFARGSFRLTSYVRPSKLFTAHSSLVANQVGELQPVKFSAIRDVVLQMIQNG